ncbi:class A beta-lactamase [Prauserella cavernicola]|uniref:Beta-lactamase n=1 Tax=Prauserella cavernicola TaxID=2800127 RepID=A0A934QQF8_9PSEU|nr:class A beta-lactamase [Prauserella cavernicola]MBK1784307.1 class A beta-lactamase [Prauserella cavernicola]
MSASRITRRGALTLAALLPLAGCATAPPPRPRASAAPTTTPPQRHDRLAELERDFGARLGVFAVATGTGATIEHRAEERFAFCSTFKALAAAAVLRRNPLSHLQTRVRYTEADLLASSFVTEQYVATGMTIRQLCDAAVRYSDGTAGNLLLRDLGGPAELTAFARELGDRTTRMDRIEPEITQATPGDPRDTTSPAGLATSVRAIVLGDALPGQQREFLRDLLRRNTTGDDRIRAGVPRDWVVADKTGTGSYGTANDVAVLWLPDSEPVVLALMSSKPDEDAEPDEALLAEAASYVATTLSPQR